METVIRRFWIHTLKAQWVLRQYICAALAKEFEAGKLTVEKQSAIVHRWDDALKESYVLQLMIDLLERQVKEECGSTESLIPKA
jgi:hypothetical protein